MHAPDWRLRNPEAALSDRSGAPGLCRCLPAPSFGAPVLGVSPEVAVTQPSLRARARSQTCVNLYRSGVDSWTAARRGGCPSCAHLPHPAARAAPAFSVLGLHPLLSGKLTPSHVFNLSRIVPSKPGSHMPSRPCWSYLIAATYRWRTQPRALALPGAERGMYCP